MAQTLVTSGNYEGGREGRREGVVGGKVRDETMGGREKDENFAHTNVRRAGRGRQGDERGEVREERGERPTSLSTPSIIL